MPVLALDAGNLLFKNIRLSPGLHEQDQATAEGIAAAYSAMGFDAVGVAARDLAGGLAFLKKIRDSSRFAWLSANLVQKDTKEPIFTPYLIREFAKIRVAIIGLTDEQVSNQFNEEDRVSVLPWRTVLPPLVSKLSKMADLLVLLSNYPPVINQEIATSVPGIPVIIQAGPGLANFTPQRVRNTLICQSGKKGKYLGWLAINWATSHTWKAENPIKLLQRKRNELESVNSRIKRYESRMKPERLTSLQTYRNLLRDRDRLQAEIKALMLDSGLPTQPDELYSSYKNHYITIEKSMPDDQDVLEIVEKTKQRVHEIGLNQKKRWAAALPPAASAGNTAAVSGNYAGWNSCAGCHPVQTDFWAKTGHAKAYEALVTRKQNYNFDCLACHVTFEQDAAGAALLSLPADLQQVSCEACHGPDNGHGADPAGQQLTAKPAAALCRQCHTPEQDDNFNYETDIKVVGCPAS